VDLRRGRQRQDQHAPIVRFEQRSEALANLDALPATGDAGLAAHLEDYARLLDGGSQPRNAILITGPSGTTDIEGSYVRGAHGPGFVHVIIVNDRSRA